MLRKEKRIVVESCITCHWRCYAIPMKQNIFAKLAPRNQVVLGTDNPQFYLTELSNEYVLTSKHHKLTAAQVVALARKAFESCFAPPGEKKALLAAFDAKVKTLRKEYSV